MRIASCLLFLTVAAHAAGPQRLLTAAPGDHVPDRLIAHAPAATLERAPIAYSHGLDAAAVLPTTAHPFVAQSREFWTEVGESELHAGVPITTTMPGALIRLSPEGGAGAALDPAGVLLRGRNRITTAAEAASGIADGRALRDAGLALPAGSLVFRLAPSIGSGELEIAAPHAQGRYLLHVFEPDSPIVANLTADRDTVSIGETIRFHVGVVGATPMLASGIVAAPDGYSAELHFRRDADGGFVAEFIPDARHREGPQLWEAHAFTASRSGTHSVLRDLKTAFAVTAPAARFDGSAAIVPGADLTVALGIEAAAASRYQVSAVLYGTGADGALHPAAFAQSASWLDPGRGRIELRIDAAILGASAIRPPFELRDLRLIDQADMGVLEQRQRALIID
jgi:hypothetical protein